MDVQVVNAVVAYRARFLTGSTCDLYIHIHARLHNFHMKHIT